MKEEKDSNDVFYVMNVILLFAVSCLMLFYHKHLPIYWFCVGMGLLTTSIRQYGYWLKQKGSLLNQTVMCVFFNFCLIDWHPSNEWIWKIILTLLYAILLAFLASFQYERSRHEKE